MLKSLRRIKQATHLFSNNHIIDPEMNQILLSQRYSQDKEVEYYAKMARRGLYDHEKLFFTQRLKSIDKNEPILIVGGGCGREAFALHHMGYKVDVLDISSPMIQKGRRLAQKLNIDVHFTYSTLDNYNTKKKYAHIYICTSLINFIHGKKNRLSFLRKAFSLLKPNGQIALEVDVFQYRGIHRFNIASRLLKWKLGKYWEKGDTLRSFYGNHNNNDQTLFYHFYQRSGEVIHELKEAGFSKAKSKDDFFWGTKN